MLSLHNVLLISPPNTQPQPQPPQINSASNNAGEYVQGSWNESLSASGVEEKVCRDCGNRAKKECAFGRCRTCCKSRGYDCATHMKSTWVPAALRRDRKGTAAAAVSGSSSSGGKRLRTEIPNHNVASTPNTCNAANVSLGLRTTSSSHQDASFKDTLPGKVEAPAVFRRIRVTAIADGEGEIGYQATVTISGHVFKGFLYNSGVDKENNSIPCVTKPHPERSRTRCSPFDRPSA